MKIELENFLSSPFLSSEYVGQKTYEVICQVNPRTIARVTFDDKYFYPNPRCKIQLSVKNYKILLNKVEKTRSPQQVLGLLRDFCVPSSERIFFLFKGLFVSLPKTPSQDWQPQSNFVKMADAVFTSTGKALKVRSEPLRDVIQHAFDTNFKTVVLKDFEHLEDAEKCVDLHLYSVNVLLKFNSVRSELGHDPNYF